MSGKNVVGAPTTKATYTYNTQGFKEHKGIRMEDEQFQPTTDCLIT